MVWTILNSLKIKWEVKLQELLRRNKALLQLHVAHTAMLQTFNFPRSNYKKLTKFLYYNDMKWY